MAISRRKAPEDVKSGTGEWKHLNLKIDFGTGQTEVCFWMLPFPHSYPWQVTQAFWASVSTSVQQGCSSLLPCSFFLWKAGERDPPAPCLAYGKHQIIPVSTLHNRLVGALLLFLLYKRGNWGTEKSSQAVQSCMWWEMDPGFGTRQSGSKFIFLMTRLCLCIKVLK